MFLKPTLSVRPAKSVRRKPTALICFLLLALSCSLSHAATENLTKTNPATTSAAGSPSATSFQSAGARTVLRVYDECTRSDFGFVPCLKKKAISFIDRIAYIDAITIADGVKLVRSTASEAPLLPLRPFSDNELESAVSASRSVEDRDVKLTHMLVERLSHYFNGHSLQVSFPRLTSDEIGRSLEEGRGKMKKLMGMMVMGMAMKMMGMIPIAMGALYMLAGKALIISKIALLLAGIMGLKKLMSGRGGSGHGGGGSSGWSSGGGGGGGGWSSGGGGGGSGGWDRRSLNEAQEVAYRGYRQQKQQQQQVPLVKEQQQQQQKVQNS